jgi:predicted nucleic acid-binding Zn ribbon protein
MKDNICVVCKKEVEAHELWKAREGCTEKCRLIFHKKREQSFKIKNYKKIIKAYFKNIKNKFIEFTKAFTIKPIPYRDYIPSEVSDLSKRVSSRKWSNLCGITKTGSIGSGNIEIDGKIIKTRGHVWYEG